MRTALCSSDTRRKTLVRAQLRAQLRVHVTAIRRRGADPVVPLAGALVDLHGSAYRWKNKKPFVNLL